MRWYYNVTKMRLTTNPFPRLLIVFALFVAMASSGFAHRFQSSPVDESLSAYLAAGGTYQDICSDAGLGGHGSGQSCDACRLVDSVALGALAAICDPSPAVIAVATNPSTALPLQSFVADPSRPVRAPPLV